MSAAATTRKRYSLVQMADLVPLPCPCGLARRAFTDEPEQTASLHVTEIKSDARTHYHKKMTELYYVLEGEGRIELDGESLPVRPGSAIMIRPGCRHRAVGQLKVLIVPVPAFDVHDEWFD